MRADCYSLNAGGVLNKKARISCTEALVPMRHEFCDNTLKHGQLDDFESGLFRIFFCKTRVALRSCRTNCGDEKTEVVYWYLQLPFWAPGDCLTQLDLPLRGPGIIRAPPWNILRRSEMTPTSGSLARRPIPGSAACGKCISHFSTTSHVGESADGRLRLVKGSRRPLKTQRFATDGNKTIWIHPLVRLVRGVPALRPEQRNYCRPKGTP